MTPDAIRMQAVVKGLATVSDKIRALDRAGYKRADIARFLGRRYQHVRNVLVADQETRKPASREPARETSLRPDPKEDRVSRSVKVRIGGHGDVIIPASFCEALGLAEGDVLFARLDSGEIHLMTPVAAMRRAQALVRQFVPEGVSLVDALIEDRRREVEGEAEHG
jgi:bifunctional DNA-binding transcriptional regulator/antitoxin component of YhaV-PrlF toxin-antitoxin module